MGIDSTITNIKGNKDVVIKGKKVKSVHDSYVVKIRGQHSCKVFNKYCQFRLNYKLNNYRSHKFDRDCLDSDSLYLFDIVCNLLNMDTLKKNRYFPRFTSNNYREGFKMESIRYLLDMYAEYKDDDNYKLIKYVYDNFRTVKISEITDSESVVYDISVNSEEHSFIANGYVVHNCNRKIGSDMADSATGGGLHGKSLSKGDVSINIYVWLKAQILKEKVEISCAIGDNIVDGRPYSEIVSIAKQYIDEVGGFEKFAEWGLVRPWQCSVKLSNYKDYFKE